jgi:hypothetical protein
MYKVPAFLLVFLLSLYPSAVRAQSTNASVTGRVRDPSKAAVPEAKVAAVNLGTNFLYESVTNGTGKYALSNLPPGTYQLEVERPGSRKLIRPDVSCMCRMRWRSISRSQLALFRTLSRCGQARHC